MMKYVLSLVVVAILAGCTSTPNLPPRDTIVAMKPTESGIVASSAKYSYRFVRDGVPQEYQRYKTFYERFHQQASGVRVNFVVVQHEVTAEYLVVMDQRKLDAGQHSEVIPKALHATARAVYLRIRPVLSTSHHRQTSTRYGDIIDD